MRHAECQQRHEALRVELEAKHSELRAELGSKIESLTGDVSELKRLGSFVEDVFVSVLPSLQEVRPFRDHEPRLKHHLELGIQAIQVAPPVHTSADIELSRMEVRLREKDVLIARLEEEARLRKHNHELTMAENAKLVVENESLKTELGQRTAQLEHKQNELSTLHENIRCLKESSLHANMKAAQRHSRLYLETCYKLGNAMDVVLKNTTTDFSRQRFHEDLYAYSRGLRERAMNPPNMRPFVEFSMHRDDDSDDEDDDLEGIDDSPADGPSGAGRGTPVPTSTKKRHVEESHGGGCSGAPPRSRPSSRASNASPSKRSKPSGSGKEPLNIVELCRGSNALMKEAERGLANRK
jgi:regulator of replication initiation timing